MIRINSFTDESKEYCIEIMENVTNKNNNKYYLKCHS